MHLHPSEGIICKNFFFVLYGRPSGGGSANSAFPIMLIALLSSIIFIVFHMEKIFIGAFDAGGMLLIC